MKQKDKQNISQLEKKLKAEQEARSFVEKQLMEEKKRKKLEEATAARAVAFAAASRYVHDAPLPTPTLHPRSLHNQHPLTPLTSLLCIGGG